MAAGSAGAGAGGAGAGSSGFSVADLKDVAKLVGKNNENSGGGGGGNYWDAVYNEQGNSFTRYLQAAKAVQTPPVTSTAGKPAEKTNTNVVNDLLDAFEKYREATMAQQDDDKELQEGNVAAVPQQTGQNQN